MDVLDVERRIAAGEQALQARLTFVTERANQRKAHDAEQGIFKRWRPIGLAALKRSVAQRRTGDVGPALTRADGAMLPQEKRLRGRDSCSCVGPFKVARTGDRTPGAPGLCPLDAQVHLPERGDSSCWPEWRTAGAGAPPFQARAGCLAQLFELEVAERVVRALAPEAPQDDEDSYTQRPVPPEASAGARLVVSVDGKGVPMRKAAAAPLKATLGPGEKRQKQQEALVGGSDMVDPKPCAPEALTELLVKPEAARARRPGDHGTDDAPRAQQVRRVASLGRTPLQGRERIKADAERRDPQHHTPVVLRLDGALGLGRQAPQLFPPWKRGTYVLDSLPVVGDLWSAAQALGGAPSQAGQRWGQQQLTAMRRGRVGDVIGGLRHILTTQRRRQAVRETLANVITFLHHHRRWRPYDASLAAGLPIGTGVVESACGAVVQHRMEGEDQRWSLAGAAAMLTLRALKKSHDHALRDDWRFHARQVRVRLYGRQPH